MQYVLKLKSLETPNLKYLQAWQLADFVGAVMKYEKLGAVPLDGSYQKIMNTYQVIMDVSNLVEDTDEVEVVEPFVTPTKTVDIINIESTSPFIEPTKVIDSDTVIGFNGDKDKLEKYGLTFGIDLKKNKSFKNMLLDLQTHLEK